LISTLYLSPAASSSDCTASFTNNASG
jgi:hypothetical protein